jgi:hypothetical protein
LLGEQVVSGDDLMAGGGRLGDAHRFAGELLGTEVSRRRVGEVAGEKHRCGDPLDAAAIGIVGGKEAIAGFRRALL